VQTDDLPAKMGFVETVGLHQSNMFVRKSKELLVAGRDPKFSLSKEIPNGGHLGIFRHALIQRKQLKLQPESLGSLLHWRLPIRNPHRLLTLLGDSINVPTQESGRHTCIF
jgi:hypothetical protein